MRLPSCEHSRIALIGTSRYPHGGELHDLPSVVNNVAELRSIFTDPELCGMRAEHCLTLLDPDTPAQVDEWLEDIARQSRDLLLVYYTGHGVLGEDDELYLTVRESDQNSIHRSGLPFAWVKRAILDSPARTRVLILDCCYSGHALSRMGAGVAAAIRQVDIEGTHVLTASGANLTARAPESAEFTAFTGALAHLLRHGVAGGPEYLTLGYLFPVLERTLTAAGMPRPHQQSKDTAGSMALVRNAAFLSDSTPAPVLEIRGGVPEPRTRVGYVPAIKRLKELRETYPDYSPRVYDRLAATYHDQGYENDADDVLIAKQRHRYQALATNRPLVGHGLLLWSWLQRTFLGYGYRPARALMWLVNLTVAGFLWFNFSLPLQPVNLDDVPVWNPMLFTLDLILPVIDLGHDGRWRLAGADQWVAAGLIVSGWVLFAVTIAGFMRQLSRRFGLH